MGDGIREHVFAYYLYGSIYITLWRIIMIISKRFRFNVEIVSQIRRNLIVLEINLLSLEDISNDNA